MLDTLHTVGEVNFFHLTLILRFNTSNLKKNKAEW